MELEGIITAMVTPFDENGRLAEDRAEDLMRHLLAHGSDGLALAGSTGEGWALGDDEKVALWEIGADVSGDAPLIAATGTSDTRHSVELTERAAVAGADAVLVVTPYYNKPSRRGLIAHYEAVARATHLPVVLYNIPQRTALDMPNDLLRELAQIEGVVAIKQARADDYEPIEGLAMLAGDDAMLAMVLDRGGAGGILVASHLVGRLMRRMIDEPGRRAEIAARLGPLFEALSAGPNPVPLKAALNLHGHEVGPPQLPLVQARPAELRAVQSALRGLPVQSSSVRPSAVTS